jgi:hypothetical protein
VFTPTARWSGDPEPGKDRSIGHRVRIGLHPLPSIIFLGSPSVEALRRRGFFRIQKKVYFILKTLGSLEGTTDPQRWDVFRSDVDTW